MSVYYIMEQCRHALSDLAINLETNILPQVPQSGQKATCIGKKRPLSLLSLDGQLGTNHGGDPSP